MEGSSPRMRGSRETVSKQGGMNGIIPAHAGLTSIVDIKAVMDWGSSPRMRGSHAVSRADPAAGGIIPAHAGLTQVTLRDSESCRDHPRACGAHSEFLDSRRFVLGSSPRMRGSQEAMAEYFKRDGIIPAHAGLTPARNLQHSIAQDHPRACGAHTQLDHKKIIMTGSSPRMRGSPCVCKMT